MEYYVVCDTDGHKFCEEIDFEDESAIYDVIADQFGDIVHEAIDSHNPQPCGFFPMLNYDEMYSDANDYLIRVAEDCHVFIRIVDDSGTLISQEKVDLCEIFNEILDNRVGCECAYVDMGPHIIEALEKFLAQGVWQFGLQSKLGSINNIPSTWPEPAISENKVSWSDKSGELKPIIWFGLADEQPIECWTLCKDEEMFEIMPYIEPYAVERWKSIWFNQFWAFDWNILLDNDGEALIIWMFAECGLCEPELEDTIVTCPIKLDENDTPEKLKGKIDSFFLKQYNATHK